MAKFQKLQVPPTNLRVTHSLWWSMDGHYIPPSRSLRKNQLSADPHPNLRSVGHATICGLSSWLTPKTHTRRLGKGQDTLVPMERRSDHASWSRDEDQTLKSPASVLITNDQYRPPVNRWFVSHSDNS